MILPALSIRQPWAWLIVHGHKNIENRTWSTPYRGRLLIHASGNIDPPDARVLGHQRSLLAAIDLPADLQRGGIVGEVVLIDIVEDSTSPWFTGPYGWVVERPRARRFRRYRGRQKLFPIDLSHVATL